MTTKYIIFVDSFITSNYKTIVCNNLEKVEFYHLHLANPGKF